MAGGGSEGGKDEDATSGITLQRPSKSLGSICRPRASLDHLKENQIGRQSPLQKPQPPLSLISDGYYTVFSF